MSYQHQQQGQEQEQQTSITELDNLIDELVKDNLLKVRELLSKIDETAKKEGLGNDEIDIIIHQRYLDALRNKIMNNANTTTSNRNTNSRSPYFQYFK